MNVKHAILRTRADQDVQEAIDYYLAEGAQQAAVGFVDALEQALRHIERNPATGSPRYAHELSLPGLRTWQLNGYPYIVFYVERESDVDVWRVLHGMRDIPAWMAPPE